MHFLLLYLLSAAAVAAVASIPIAPIVIPKPITDASLANPFKSDLVIQLASISFSNAIISNILDQCASKLVSCSMFLVSIYNKRVSVKVQNALKLLLSINSCCIYQV
ncbi:Hypothetical_protein [Hexamita inflata]|uniref:Hypothetical_protein n=1 Tax=Hexamita inflata TaxID=28002 RepID=A0AA86RBX0_9EUKA|nr:Hypothetical protein HINF_LOCUS61032 [Hexamita inflata]